MPIIKVPWVKLPHETNFEQLKNGKRGVVLKISEDYVGKILYSKRGDEEKGDEEYSLRDDKRALEELEHERDINWRLYENKIGNVPRPIGVERLLISDTCYYTFIMEYIKLPRGDEIGHVDLAKATDLAKIEFLKAMDIGLEVGDDALNEWNFFYDPENNKVRLIDFGRWFFDQGYQI